MNDRDDDNVEVDENYNPEEEVYEGYTSSVNLPEVPVVTGEEDEEVVAKFRTKLYRWTNKEWKERGIGEFKILQNKTTKKFRSLMRQEKTHKIVANHFIHGEKLCSLSKMQTHDKAWVWNCCDFSDDAAKIEKLCARFTSVADYEKFQQEFEKAYQENIKLQGEKKKEGETKAEEAKSEVKKEQQLIERERLDDYQILFYL